MCVFAVDKTGKMLLCTVKVQEQESVVGSKCTYTAYWGRLGGETLWNAFKASAITYTDVR